MELNGKFHRTERGAPPDILKVRDVECGRPHGTNVLALTHHFAGDPNLETLNVLLLQEVVTEPGKLFHEHKGWVLIYGKHADDWRGTGIAYKNSQHKHSNASLLSVGIATTLTTHRVKRGIRFLAGQKAT